MDSGGEWYAAVGYLAAVSGEAAKARVVESPKSITLSELLAHARRSNISHDQPQNHLSGQKFFKMSHLSSIDVGSQLATLQLRSEP